MKRMLVMVLDKNNLSHRVEFLIDMYRDLGLQVDVKQVGEVLNKAMISHIIFDEGGFQNAKREQEDENA